MKFKQKMIGMICVSSFILANAYAENLLAKNQATQSIQIVNLLGNNDLPDPGMTTTGVIIKVYNGSQSPCWVTSLNYKSDTTIYAGPYMGCGEKVNEIIISPIHVVDKLKTYGGPITVPVDTSKYASQITIIQDQAPLFDTQSGLVSKQGTVKIKSQTQFLS